jgi:hypothetical protein
MAEKSSWDQANRWQKLGLVWRNRKKISQIIKDYFYLPFFLLIILWVYPTLPSPIVKNDFGLLLTIKRHALKGLEAIFRKNRAPLLYSIPSHSALLQGFT